jgi:predicted Fe-Mo cluster-binding NifX family protein
MAWRIAVTSADGVLINQHFGHARWFLIYDVEQDGTSTLAERREVVPWCNAGNHAGHAAHAAHTGPAGPRGGPDDTGDSGIAGDIGDCTAVLTARIGPPARKNLELAGISVFEEVSAIDEALKKLARYYAKTQRDEKPVRALEPISKLG